MQNIQRLKELFPEEINDEEKKCHERVVFKDKNFADANVKTNAIQVLKQFDIDEVVSV